MAIGRTPKAESEVVSGECTTSYRQKEGIVMKKTRLASYAIIALGITITTIAYKIALNPFSISVGGVTGLCVLLQSYFGISYSVAFIVLNLGLFLWGMRVKGIAYVARSFIAMEVLGFLLDYPFEFSIWMMPQSSTSAMIIGSLLSGVGYGLIVATDTSTGGSDLLGMIVTQKIPRLSTGVVMTALDLVVIILAGFLDGLASFMFSLVAMTLCNATIDLVVFWVGKGTMPAWLEKLTNCFAAVQRCLASVNVTISPYAALVTFLLIIVIRSAIMNASSLIIMA